MTENVTLSMIYDELKYIRKELEKVEYAVIPSEQLSDPELQEHKKDLKDAMKNRLRR